MVVPCCSTLLCCSPRERYTLITLYLFPAGASHVAPRGSEPRCSPRERSTLRAPYFAHLCSLYECFMLLHTALLLPAGALHTDHAPRVFHGSASTASIRFHTAARFTLPTLVLRVAHRAFTCYLLWPQKTVSVRPSVRLPCRPLYFSAHCVFHWHAARVGTDQSAGQLCKLKKGGV